MDIWTRPWRHYVDFAGRSRRLEYLLFWVTFYGVIFGIVTIAGIIAPIISGAVSNSARGSGLMSLPFILVGLFMLSAILPAIALSVRRLHDLGLSGWWMLVWFVPILGQVLGWLLSFIIIFIPGPRGENQYGLDPHDPEEMDTQDLGQVFR